MQRKVNWTMLFEGVTMLAVVIGVTIGASELRHVRNAQETQAMLLLYQASQTPEYIRGSYIIANLPDTVSIATVDSLFAGPDRLELRGMVLTYEALGAMVYRGDIPIEWVDELFRFSITGSWKKVGPAIEARRDRLRYPALMEWFQWLAERLEERTDSNATPAYERYRNWRPDR
jgi:hypothetical protein